MSVPRYWREIPIRYRLIGSRCKICKTTYYPPRTVCPKCKEARHGGGPVMQMEQFSGNGYVRSFTTIHVGPQDFKDQTPYTMAIIKMDEGPRITGQVIDCDKEDIKIGMRVKAVLRRIRQEGETGVIYYGYKFRPDPASKGPTEKPRKSESK